MSNHTIPAESESVKTSTLPASIPNSPDENIEKIYIGGGACRLPGFKNYLEMETRIPIEALNPFAHLEINEKIFDPRYLSYMGPQAGVAVGLALRSIDDK